jgi:hypothetical protein
MSGKHRSDLFSQPFPGRHTDIGELKEHAETVSGHLKAMKDAHIALNQAFQDLAIPIDKQGRLGEMKRELSIGEAGYCAQRWLNYNKACHVARDYLFELVAKYSEPVPGKIKGSRPNPLPMEGYARLLAWLKDANGYKKLCERSQNLVPAVAVLISVELQKEATLAAEEKATRSKTPPAEPPAEPPARPPTNRPHSA